MHHLAEQGVPEVVPGLVGGEHRRVDRLAQAAVEVDERHRSATESSSSWLTRLPATAASSTTCWASSERVWTRTFSASRSVSGMSTQPRAAERVSSSTKYGMPSLRRWTVSTTGLLGGRSSSRVSSSATSARSRLRHIDPYGAGQPADLGQEGAQRMPAGQLVGAVAGDDHHRRVGERPGQEAQQVPGRLVGPVDVLDDHHQRAVLARPLPEPGDGLEQLQPDGVGPFGSAGQVGQQHPEGGPAGAGPVQHLLSAVLGDQVAQGADDRRVRQALAAQRHALAADQLGLAVGERPEQVGREGLDRRSSCPTRRRRRRGRSGCRR